MRDGVTRAQPRAATPRARRRGVSGKVACVNTENGYAAPTARRARLPARPARLPAQRAKLTTPGAGVTAQRPGE